jgi:hypothetical protein
VIKQRAGERTESMPTPEVWNYSCEEKKVDLLLKTGLVGGNANNKTG